MIVFGIALLLRIVYNILCLTTLGDGNTYTIFSTFVYVICIAFPLLYVFTQNLLEIQKPLPIPSPSVTREEYVGRLSNVEQNLDDDALRRVSDIIGNELESEEELPRFRETSMPFEDY